MNILRTRIDCKDIDSDKEEDLVREHLGFYPIDEKYEVVEEISIFENPNYKIKWVDIIVRTKYNEFKTKQFKFDLSELNPKPIVCT